MKKVLVLTAVLCAAFTIETHAIGIGLQGGINFLDGHPAPSILISPNDYVHGAATWYIDLDDSSIFLLAGSLDYWFFTLPLTTLGPAELSLFVGAGAYAQILLGNDDFGFGAGARLPVGVDWKADRFDVFVQLVPYTGLDLLPSLGFSGLHFDANIGIRIWF
jgi:hypothetical protein